MKDQTKRRDEDTEREKLFGAFRRLNAILRRSPTLEDLEIDTATDLAQLRVYWTECWQAMDKILSGQFARRL